MLCALNDPLSSFVFIDCLIVWKCMLKCVLRVRIQIYILTLFINQMLESGIFPDSLKIAKIIPLYKKRKYKFHN